MVHHIVYYGIRYRQWNWLYFKRRSGMADLCSNFKILGLPLIGLLKHIADVYRQLNHFPSRSCRFFIHFRIYICFYGHTIVSYFIDFVKKTIPLTMKRTFLNHFQVHSEVCWVLFLNALKLSHIYESEFHKYNTKSQNISLKMIWNI